ncbi:MAG: glycosyltransferase family 4 protein [Chloroflexi bacterium]|nr:glycosyltransferase family 4 protein [Chloroflexota bacterium]
MNVAYYLTVPNAPLSECDAVVQEVVALESQTATHHRIYLYPSRHPGTRIPRFSWGLRYWFALKKLDQQVDLHHIFNPDPFWFPILHAVRKPIVYTAVTGIGTASQTQVTKVARRVHTLVVPTEDDVHTLLSWGIKNTAVIPTGIDTEQFTFNPVAKAQPLTILMGSAPWTVAQFASKGVDALLKAAQTRPNLHLIFLWRGVLFEEMCQRVANAGLENRVQVLNKQVDVNMILAQVHAAVVMADNPVLVKAFPHSLLESLVAGKPVLASETLPIAHYVQQNACGEIVTAVTTEAFLIALDKLINQYDHYQEQARLVGIRDFGHQQFISGYQTLYQTIKK